MAINKSRHRFINRENTHGIHAHQYINKQAIMASKLSHLLLLLLLSLLFSVAAAASAAAAADSIFQYCAKSYNSSQAQAASIDAVLSDLVAKASIGGFATSSSGDGNNAMYGLAQCRGDVSSDDCSACLAAAADKLPSSDGCPSQADARIWYDYCFVHYDDEDFFTKVDTVGGILYNVENATDPAAFDDAVGTLMSKVSARAVQPGSGSLGTGKEEFTPEVTIYALAQCTRDLAPLACAQCLSSAVETNFPTYCPDRKGCRVLYSSCMVRYEVYPFFFPLDGSDESSTP